MKSQAGLAPGPSSLQHLIASKRTPNPLPLIPYPPSSDPVHTDDEEARSDILDARQIERPSVVDLLSTPDLTRGNRKS